MNMIAHIDWHVVVIVLGGMWSVFWSYAPTPEPNTWYNAIFHTAQFLALNPGRSIAVMTKHRNENGNGNGHNGVPKP